jgi:branched-chain amino acid transport system substrate-binding protein
MKTAVFAAGAVAAGLVLAACASSGSSGAAGGSGAHAAVQVGYLLPLTGVFTSNGTSEENGFKLGLKNFGSSVDGHPVNVTYLNTQGEPTVAESDAVQLVARDHVQVVEGPLVSSEIAVVARPGRWRQALND